MTGECQSILRGQRYLCSHPGSSQYTTDGSSSACGLAAMNCVRYVFASEEQGITGSELIRKLLSREAMDVSNSSPA